MGRRTTSSLKPGIFLAWACIRSTLTWPWALSSASVTPCLAPILVPQYWTSPGHSDAAPPPNGKLVGLVESDAVTGALLETMPDLAKILLPLSHSTDRPTLATALSCTAWFAHAVVAAGSALESHLTSLNGRPPIPPRSWLM